MSQLFIDPNVRACSVSRPPPAPGHKSPWSVGTLLICQLPLPQCSYLSLCFVISETCVEVPKKFNDECTALSRWCTMLACQKLMFWGTGQEVEVAVTLLYQLGEGAPEETLKPGSGALGQMAAGARTHPAFVYIGSLGNVTSYVILSVQLRAFQDNVKITRKGVIRTC